eukprot:gene3202-biopygen6805
MPFAAGNCAAVLGVQSVHWLNASFGVSKALKRPGSSLLGRRAHHLLDGACHTAFAFLSSSAYR